MAFMDTETVDSPGKSEDASCMADGVMSSSIGIYGSVSKSPIPVSGSAGITTRVLAGTILSHDSTEGDEQPIRSKIRELIKKI